MLWLTPVASAWVAWLGRKERWRDAARLVSTRCEVFLAAAQDARLPLASYLISQVEVIDADAWKNHRTRAPQVIASFGGRYLVEGHAPK